MLPSLRGIATLSVLLSGATLLEAQNPIQLEKKQDIVLGTSIQSACPAAAGKKMVVYLPQEDAVAVVDLVAGKVAGKIPFKGTGVRLAAGKNHVLIASENPPTIECYDLTTLKKTDTKPLPHAKIKCFAGSSGTDDPALIVLADNISQGTKLVYYWATPGTIKLDKLQPANAHVGAWREKMRLRASTDGKIYGYLNEGGAGLWVLLARRPESTLTFKGIRVHEVMPSAKGNFICTFFGIYSVEGSNLEVCSGRCIPAIEGDYFLEFALRFEGLKGQLPATVNVFKFGESKPSAKVTIDSVNGQYAGFDFTLDRRVQFLPESGILAVIPLSNERVVVHRFTPLK